MTTLRPWNRGRTVHFVVGYPRSGTTWTAGALAAALDAHVVDEPYNWKPNPFLMACPAPDGTDWRFLKVLADTIDRLPADGRPVVVKEVHAIPAMPALRRAFGGEVVVAHRHPAAVALSWHRLGWRVPPTDAWLRGRLLERHLAPFAGHLRTDGDWWWRFGAYWGAGTWVLRRQWGGHPRATWLVHESACASPLITFGTVLDRMGADAAALGRLALYLAEHDRPPRPDEPPKATFRVTAATPDRWRAEVTDGQLDAIVAGAAPFGLDPVTGEARADEVAAR